MLRTLALKIAKDIHKDLEQIEVDSNQVAQEANVGFIYSYSFIPVWR